MSGVRQQGRTDLSVWQANFGNRVAGPRLRLTDALVDEAMDELEEGESLSDFSSLAAADELLRVRRTVRENSLGVAKLFGADTVENAPLALSALSSDYAGHQPGELYARSAIDDREDEGTERDSFAEAFDELFARIL